MELWQTADQELDRLQRIHQQTVSDHEGQDAERRQLKVQQPAHMFPTVGLSSENQSVWLQPAFIRTSFLV